jgi:hypothetical protein
VLAGLTDREWTAGSGSGGLGVRGCRVAGGGEWRRCRCSGRWAGCTFWLGLLVLVVVVMGGCCGWADGVLGLKESQEGETPLRLWVYKGRPE